jgi:hypothetical protein
LSRTSGVSKVPAPSGVSVPSGHSQPSDCSSFRCSSEFPAPHGVPTVDLRLFRAFRNPPSIDLPVGTSSAIPAGIDLVVGTSSALAAGINLAVGTSSAHVAGIDLAVGSPSALAASTDQRTDLLRPYRSATTFRSAPTDPYSQQVFGFGSRYRPLGRITSHRPVRPTTVVQLTLRLTPYPSQLVALATITLCKLSSDSPVRSDLHGRLCPSGTCPRLVRHVGINLTFRIGFSRSVCP